LSENIIKGTTEYFLEMSLCREKKKVGLQLVNVRMFCAVKSEHLFVELPSVLLFKCWRIYWRRSTQLEPFALLEIIKRFSHSVLQHGTKDRKEISKHRQ